MHFNLARGPVAVIHRAVSSFPWVVQRGVREAGGDVARVRRQCARGRFAHRRFGRRGCRWCGDWPGRGRSPRPRGGPRGGSRGWRGGRRVRGLARGSPAWLRPGGSGRGAGCPTLGHSRRRTGALPARGIERRGVDLFARSGCGARSGRRGDQVAGPTEPDSRAGLVCRIAPGAGRGAPLGLPVHRRRSQGRSARRFRCAGHADSR